MPRAAQETSRDGATGRWQLTVVRHARAGSKRAWKQADHLRPLDATGRRRAERLAELLARGPVTRLLSSPARRCLETLEPLAALVGLPIEESEVLAAHADSTGLLAWVADPVFADVVLCTHGEVMQPLLATVPAPRLVDGRVRGGGGGGRSGGGGGGGKVDRDRLMTKGSAWRLTVSANGRVVELEHVLPRG